MHVPVTPSAAIDNSAGAGLDIPDFLRVENRKPPTADQQARIDAAMARAHAPEREDLRARQQATKKQKSRLREDNGEMK
jgi:hypothetical protein